MLGSDRHMRRLIALVPPLVLGAAAVAWALIREDGGGLILLLVIIAALALFAGAALLVLLRQLEKAERDQAVLAASLEQSETSRRALAKAAAHDMLEPLRKIEAFGGRLEDKYSASLDDHGLLYLDRMTDGARRLKRLIEKLLTFSRLDDRPSSRDVCDLNMILKAVIQEHQPKLDALDAELVVAPLPAVLGDPRQLQILFSEMLDNALKFHRPGQAVHIEIRHERVECEGEIREKISLMDAGIGFDPKYAERVFGVLDRLHSRSEYEGTGMGLAIAAKIAALHDGALTANAEPGQGASFTLILPG